MKEKKTIIILILVLTIGIVGLTIAYFSNSTSVNNVFTTQPYGTTVTENFTSPSNWLPGQEVDKTVVATNTGNVDEAVRISFEESWTPYNTSSTLNGWIHQDGSKSSHTTESELANDERVAVIDFDNDSDWDYEDGYYYYKYKIAPGETTSSLIKSVTFNSKTKLDDTCTTTEGNGTKTITCNSSGSDYDHATYTLTFTVETVQYNKYVEAWGTNVAIAKSKPMTLQQFVAQNTNASNAEYNATTKKNMFVFTHGEGANQVTESRYIGNDPNNYVYFNCTDDEDTSTCEKWRIIGTFEVERTDPTDSTKTITETRMKLVRGDILEKRVFNSSSNNDWTVAPLMTYLNGDYYNGTVTKGLTESARNKIESAKYYLGAISWVDSTSGYGSVEKIYGEERGTTICGACNGNSEKLTWEGNVGLMYPSDMYMVYKGVDDTCYTNPSGCGSSAGKTNGWVYNTNKLSGSITYTWLLSSHAGPSGTVLYGSLGAGLNYLNSTSNYGVRPVVYLKSDIKITEGTGESTNPYKLGL